jgi:toxin ParE1/3/4
MNVRYSPRATRDLTAIHEFLTQRSPAGAAHVLAAIYAAVEFIKRYPLAAEITNISGVYGKLVKKYRFKVFYRIIETDRVVEIVHVRHTSRRLWEGE